MSQTIQANKGNAANIKTDRAKLFLWDNRTNKGLFDEPAGSGEYTLKAGQVLGRIASTGKLKICSVASTDGSQYPIGIVAGDVTMAQDATDVSVTYCLAGDVAQELLLFSGAETLASFHATNTLNQTLRDLLQKAGLNIVATDDLTTYDNDL